MDLFTLLRVMLRRWWVALPVLVVAGLVSYRLVDDRAVEYTAVGSQLLVSPQLPIANQSITPDLAATVLTELMAPANVREQLAAAGLDVDASAELGTSGTAVVITTTGPESADVVEAAAVLTEKAPQLMAEALGPDAGAVRLTVPNAPDAANVVVFGDESTLQTTVLVLPAELPQVNPFPATLGTVRSLLEVSLTVEVAIEVANAAPTARYEVSSELRDAAPIVRIAVLADTPEDAGAGYGAVADSLAVQLDLIQEQAGVPAEQRTTLRDLAAPAGVGETSASIVRPVAGVAVLGLGVALALAVLVDALIMRRRRAPAATEMPSAFESIPPAPIHHTPTQTHSLPAPRALPAPRNEQR